MENEEEKWRCVMIWKGMMQSAFWRESSNRHVTNRLYIPEPGAPGLLRSVRWSNKMKFWEGPIEHWRHLGRVSHRTRRLDLTLGSIRVSLPCKQVVFRAPIASSPLMEQQDVLGCTLRIRLDELVYFGPFQGGVKNGGGVTQPTRAGVVGLCPTVSVPRLIFQNPFICFIQSPPPSIILS